MNLLKALATVSSMTLLSRIFGLIRDTLIASNFKTGLYTDAFFVAFKIPNLLRRLFAEGAFSQAFVPILAEYKNRRGDEETHRLIDHVAGLLMLILIVVTAIGVIAAPLVIYISAPGFYADKPKFDLTIDLLRIIFPYILFISFVSLSAGILNTYSKFSVPAFTPVLLNITMIVFSIWVAPYFNPPIIALAWAVFLGGVVQLAFQIPFLWRIKMVPRFTLDFRDEGVWRIMRLMGPAVFGVSIAQLSLLINTIFASFLRDGSVTWLYYADRLMEFPSGMLGVALGTILLPSLSKYYSDKSNEEYSKLLDWGLRLTLLLALPAALALAVIAVPLVSTVFYHGAFTVNDLYMTRQALIAYSAGLLGIIMVKVLAPGFYARQNIKTPVKIAVITLAVTQLMNLLFVFVLSLGHAGLALAIGLGACLNAGLLFYKLRRHGVYIPQPGWLLFSIKLFVALLVLGLVLWFGAGYDSVWLRESVLHRVVRLSAVVIGGALIYFATLWLLGFRVQQFIKRGAT